MFEAFQYLEFDIVVAEVETFGDVASAYGTFTWLAEPRAGGDQISYDGKFLTLFRKQPDRSWKILRDVFNSNAP
jgi:ketosteroid isomerase-like protein